MPIYRVTGASDLSSWQVRKTRNVSRFVNRSHEIALLRRVAGDTSASGRTVCLTGDPGMGKSRLVHEFVQELETEGWRLIAAECSPNLQGAPFAALKGCCAQFLAQRRGRSAGNDRPRGLAANPAISPRCGEICRLGRAMGRLGLSRAAALSAGAARS